MSTGSNLIAGVKKHTGAWGHLAMLIGAGDGVEIEKESIGLNAALIENMGLYGQGTQRPGTLGAILSDGDFGPAPAYYRGLEALIAHAMGADTVTQLGGTAAYEHAMHIAALTGKYVTLAMGGADHPAVREAPAAKVGGFTFEAKASDMARFTFPVVASRLHLNELQADDDLVVAAVEPADGARTIAAQPSAPSPLTVTVTDANASITEYILTIVGTDEHGKYATEAYTLSTDGLTWTSRTRWAAITSITGSGLAGSATGDTVKVGVSGGVNNPGTYSSISLPTSADRELISFAEMTVLINDQTGGSLATADEVYADLVRIQLDNALKSDKVTTEHKRYVSEATAGGTGFRKVTGGLNFPDWNAASNSLLKARLKAGRKKMKVTFSGPLAATGYALELSFWLNNVQFTDGTPNADGPGEMRLDLNFQAHQATSSPTGLPSWANTQPMSVRLVNLLTSAAI